MARRPRAPRPGAPTTDDAIELALEAEASGRPATGPAQLLIRKQAQLVGWQIATERTAFALKLLTAIVGVIVAVVAATLLISASQYRGLTVQPFSVPPDLETRGLNGSAVATRVLDKLTALQAATVSLRAPNSYANSWGDSVEVQIPQTGVSAGELWKFLRSWLGEEVKITGEVVRIDSGLQVTARAGGQAAPPLVGQEAELEALLDRAAEAIFAETQPYRYAIYLSRTDRADESIAVLERLAATGDETDRKWALAAWSFQLQLRGEFEAAIAKAEAALAIDPDFGLAHANLGGVLATLGRAEEAYRASRLTARTMRGDPHLDPDISDAIVAEMEGQVLGQQHDHAGAAERYRIAAQSDGQSRRGIGFDHAFQIAALHEYSRGRDLVRNGADPPSSTGALVGADMAPIDRYDSQICYVAEDWPCVVASGQTLFREPDENTPNFPAAHRLWLTQIAPLLAFAHARTGDMATAATLIARTPTDAYAAAVGRGMVAAVKGDAQASERWFARAAELAPSLADAHYYQGRARLERGDEDGAVAAFATAAARAPRWADPLKYWGDALAARGDRRGAIRKYREAAERAPRWGALHLAWGQALWADGRRDQARARWRAASRMDLNPAYRAEVTRRLALRG
jgi:tetratricopeptide (TPR) repeat protein